jgi:hypothetical protein
MTNTYDFTVVGLYDLDEDTLLVSGVFPGFLLAQEGESVTPGFDKVAHPVTAPDPDTAARLAKAAWEQDDSVDPEPFAEQAPQCRHTVCGLCELDLEVWLDEPKVGRDRGGNTRCNNGPKHVPVLD